MERSNVELAQMFAEAARALAAQATVDKTIEDIVTLAVTAVPGAEMAGISLARTGKVETPAATDELVAACDVAQYETGEGPCLQAMWEDRVLRIDDMTNEPRWPAFAARAATLGIGSMLACQLSSRPGTLSALNLYAAAPRAFDAASRDLALIYAAHAAIALESSRLESDLRAAVETRQGIGQAVGILMERHQMTARRAFELLTTTSQKLNRKVRELAQLVVDTGVDPTNAEELATLASSTTVTGAKVLPRLPRVEVEEAD